MEVIADLQLHSRFSRAVSPTMTLPNIAMWARRKGIGLVATGDWTHPIWFREIERDLEELGNGLLRLKKDLSLRAQRSNLHSEGIATSPAAPRNDTEPSTPLFLLATEVSSIYSQGGKVRRVHTLVWVPTIDSARKISAEMTKRGCNLMSDGRPIMGLSCIHIAELVLSIEPKALIIPAHAWTPWFSVYGSLGGFDSLEEAFGAFAKNIYAVETGLSSNPAMNWRIKELDTRAIVSFSDAHSGPKLGREATVFDIPDGHVSYEAIYQAIFQSSVLSSQFSDKSLPVGRLTGKQKTEEQKADNRQQKTDNRIVYTIEFYPEEGKYHYTGHRACGIRWSPEETRQKGSTCPVCGRPLTQGVMQRVEELAGRSEAELQISNIKYQISNRNTSIQMIGSKAFPNRPQFVMLVPLQEIISEAIGSPVGSPKVQGPYGRLTDALGGEFAVLLTATLEEITHVAGERIAQGIDKVRRGDLLIDPGYDGVFGVVRLWREGEEKPLVDGSREQLAMFS